MENQKKKRTIKNSNLIVYLSIPLLIIILVFIAVSQNIININLSKKYSSNVEADLIIRNTFDMFESLFDKKFKDDILITMLKGDSYHKKNSDNNYGYTYSRFGKTKMIINADHGIGYIQRLYTLHLRDQLYLSEVELEALAFYTEKYLGYMENNKLMVYYGMPNPSVIESAKALRNIGFDTVAQKSDLMYVFYLFLEDIGYLKNFLNIADSSFQLKMEKLFDGDVDHAELEWKNWFKKYTYEDKWSVFSVSILFEEKREFEKHIRGHEHFIKMRNPIITFVER